MKSHQIGFLCFCLLLTYVQWADAARFRRQADTTAAESTTVATTVPSSSENSTTNTTDGSTVDSGSSTTISGANESVVVSEAPADIPALLPGIEMPAGGVAENSTSEAPAPSGGETTVPATTTSGGLIVEETPAGAETTVASQEFTGSVMTEGPSAESTTMAGSAETTMAGSAETTVSSAPGGESPTTMSPAGGEVSPVPSGETTSASPSGETTSASPSGETTSASPSGETTSASPSGETTSASPSGETTSAGSSAETTESPFEEETTESSESGEESDIDSEIVFSFPDFSLGGLFSQQLRMFRSALDMLEEAANETATYPEFYKNTTYATVDIDGKPYRVEKTVVKRGEGDSSLFFKVVSEVPEDRRKRSVAENFAMPAFSIRNKRSV